MAVVVFLLGRPGSGKSQVARCIKGDESLAAYNLGERCLPEDWTVEHVTDYHFLQEMFQKEQALKEQERLLEKQRFCVGDQQFGGFTVIDFSVLHLALRKVNETILHALANPRELMLVEYARDNYLAALETFDQAVLQNAHFLYFEADVGVCKERISARVANRQCEDDNFVSDAIMDGYYQRDDLPLLQKVLGPERLKVIETDKKLVNVWPGIRGIVRNWCLPREGDSLLSVPIAAITLS